jgi:hypothetical protein
MSNEEIVAFSGSAMLWYTHFVQYLRMTGKSWVRFGKYEDFVKDPSVYLDAIADLLGVALGEEEHAHILDEYSLDKNRHLVRWTDVHDENWQFDQSDSPRQIPGRHCHEGKVGAWMDFVDVGGAKLMSSHLSIPLWEMGYA